MHTHHLPRLAIVTGGDSGNGQATAKLLASEGFDVGPTLRRDEDGARATAAAIEERASGTYRFRADGRIAAVTAAV